MIKTVTFPDKTKIKVHAKIASKAIKLAYAKKYGIKKPKSIKCYFTSVWSDGTNITTPCIYDPKTGEVTPESSKAMPKGCLEREYITLNNEDEIDVCKVCHEFVMKTVMNPGQAKYDLIEEEVCSNPDCDSNQ